MEAVHLFETWRMEPRHSV